MNKRLIVSIGLLTGISTPLSLLVFFDISLMDSLKTLFSFIHLLAVIVVLITDFNSKKSYQKALILLAFLVYPLLLMSDTTELFKSRTFIVAILTGWIYVMGFSGWMINLSEKSS